MIGGACGRVFGGKSPNDVGKEQGMFLLDPFVLSGVFGGKSPKGVGKEQHAPPIAPFVLSLSKGGYGEPSVNFLPLTLSHIPTLN